MSKKHKRKPNNKNVNKNKKSRPQTKPEVNVSSAVLAEETSPEVILDHSEEACLPKAESGERKTLYDKLTLTAGVVLALSAIVALIIFLSYTPDQSKTVSVSTAPGPETTVSEFEIMLDSVVNSLTSEDGLGYVIDKDYFNSDNIAAYVSIVSRKETGDISKEDIEDNLFKVFVPVKSDNVINLVQKDSETLIWECEDRTLMNKLDYAFMGATNDRIEKASRGFYISQNDDKYLKVPYGDSNIKYAGCGPASLTMALNYVNNKEVVTLDEIVQWAEENDMYEHMSGTRWALMRNFPLAVDSGCKELYIRSVETLEKSITEDSVLIVSMNKGHFTNDGHFMLITEIKDGKASVLDPSSICRSLKKWDTQIILDESNNFFWRINKSDL